MNIIDCFHYYVEKELLELRIRLLYDYVDKFIICDANRTHKGIPKDFTVIKTLLDLNIPLDKIQVINLDLSNYDSIYESIQNNWEREHTHRNEIAKYITSDDVCIISDCDEIIDPKYINYYVSIAQNNPNNILHIPMVFLHARADLEVYNNIQEPMIWGAPFICLKSHLEKYTASEIRESYSYPTNVKINLPTIFAIDNNKIERAGWHFGWMGNRIERYKACLHVNDIPNSIIMESETKALEFLNNYIPHENGTDALGRTDHILKSYDIHGLPNIIFTIPNIMNYLLPQ